MEDSFNELSRVSERYPAIQMFHLGKEDMASNEDRATTLEIREILREEAIHDLTEKKPRPKTVTSPVNTLVQMPA